MIQLNSKKSCTSVFLGILLFMIYGTVFADSSDPNMSRVDSTEATYNPNSGTQLHDSTNPVTSTGNGYYIPGDRNFDPDTTYQSRTPEEAEGRRSTTYDDRNQ